MTAESVIRNANLQPVAGTHRAGNIARRGTQGVNEALSLDQTDASFAAEIRTVLRFHEDNAAALANRRTQVRQNPTGLRIISNVGYNQLIQASMMPSWAPRASRLSDLEGAEDGRGSPVFRYIAPKTSESIRPFRDGISFCVMHSFGRGFDINKTKDRGTRTVRIDPLTGHNPRRFFNGLNTLLNPGAMSRGRNGEAPRPNPAAIHHAISLRGDLINSVSWDNRSIHGGGGSKRGVPPAIGVAANNASIGIEHEEWFVRPENNPRGHLDSITDHGPFSEEQYTIDAFILRKLESYTGQTFSRFLGTEQDGLWDNIRQRTTGCFNHKDTSGHHDPGAEFYLPVGFELNVTDFRNIPNLATEHRKWARRMRLWWSDVPDGSRICAYDRIFDKMSRMRSFNLQTEVFNPALGVGPINLGSPTISGTHTVAAAQGATLNRLNGTDRSQQMQGATRSGLYSSAQDTSSAIQVAIAAQTSRLSSITEASLRLPVVLNALGFDFDTGLWVNATTENTRTVAQVTGDPDADTEPPGEDPREIS